MSAFERASYAGWKVEAEQLEGRVAVLEAYVASLAPPVWPVGTAPDGPPMRTA